MVSRVLFLLLPLAIGAATPLPQPLADLIAVDARVAAIGHRLTVAGVGLCPDSVPATGMTVHSTAQYGGGDRAAIAATLPAGTRFALLAVAPDSAAARAGLVAGDPILAVEGEAPPPVDEDERPTFAPTAAIEGLIGLALADGRLTIDTIRDGAVRRIEIGAEPACRSRFQVRPGDRLNAAADGYYASVTTALIDFVRSDDELTLVLAHEMAHNILGHSARLDAEGVARGLFRAFGSNPGRIRATEDEADRMALYLMARAGYDYRVAPGFWDRYGRATGAGILSDRTHSSRRARIAAATREIALIDAQIAAGRAPTPEPPIAPHRSALSR